MAISRPFWIGKTEVTQAAWNAVMDSNPSRSACRVWDLPDGRYDILGFRLALVPVP